MGYDRGRSNTSRVLENMARYRGCLTCHENQAAEAQKEIMTSEQNWEEVTQTMSETPSACKLPIRQDLRSSKKDHRNIRNEKLIQVLKLIAILINF
jgi:hypothetical protein